VKKNNGRREEREKEREREGRTIISDDRSRE